MADDGLHDRIMMFTTRQNLTHLTAADIIYGDGTCYTCPDVFFQLYTFHAFVDGAIYPLVYALLPGKSQIIYTRFLTLLKEACQRFDLQLQPSTIFLDYEVAVRNAAYQVFPGITGKGCCFHYTQSVYMRKGSRYWSSDSLQEQQRHHQIGSTCSSSSTCTITTCRGHLVKCIRRNR
ncbi:uncharacterized protein LOC134717942 [Mytilus trossulus]|uniref:uncharacterized protein LOC134717942 n=1 Tax=Mytilus trossulus TaxID=6551 RepID=UPI003004672E